MKKDIQEVYYKSFKEASFDPDNGIVRNVALFGSKKSLNGRVYSDKAVDDLVRLAEGARSYLNHPTKEEIADSGVRRIQDWLGTFSNARRSNDAVIANLTVREAYIPLIKDIIRQAPHQVGFSLNGMVKVFQDAEGLEQVESVEKIRSYDLVSSAATTNSLFESAREKASKDPEEAVKEFMESIQGKKVDPSLKEKSDLFIKELRGVK